jgi:hypothetical protein
MRRLLGTPFGWIALLAVEIAILFGLLRGLTHVFPDSSTTVSGIVMGLAVVLVIGNYVLRRRYLS